MIWCHPTHPERLPHIVPKSHRLHNRVHAILLNVIIIVFHCTLIASLTLTNTDQLLIFLGMARSSGFRLPQRVLGTAAPFNLRHSIAWILLFYIAPFMHNSLLSMVTSKRPWSRASLPSFWLSPLLLIVFRCYNNIHLNDIQHIPKSKYNTLQPPCTQRFNALAAIVASTCEPCIHSLNSSLKKAISIKYTC